MLKNEGGLQGEIVWTNKPTAVVAAALVFALLCANVELVLVLNQIAAICHTSGCSLQPLIEQLFDQWMYE